ncbi:hypothetical protein H6504_05205 [Candidatus Woesearchaeota archaeon]|nr:hypothetical protein [Candidatus Woesearchaeota archaeon]
MGHTVTSQRIVIDTIIQELKDYAKALREEDRVILEDLLQQAYKHMGAISYACSMHTWALLLLTIMMEEKKHGIHRCVSCRQQSNTLDAGRKREQAPG